MLEVSSPFVPVAAYFFQADDMRVFEPGDGLRLALEAAHPGWVARQQRIEHLERDLAIEGEVQRAANDRKIILTYLGKHTVFAKSPNDFRHSNGMSSQAIQDLTAHRASFTSLPLLPLPAPR